MLDEQVVIVFTTVDGRTTAAENLISDVLMLDAFLRCRVLTPAYRAGRPR